MNNRKTILIIGISSFVGSNLAEYFKDRYRVIGTYCSNPIKIKGVLTMPCNVEEKETVQTIIAAFKPDYTIYCAGLTSLSDCAKLPTKSDSLNTIGLFTVTEFCQRYKSQLIFMSSAYVFGGDNKEYREMDTPDACTFYGKTKASAEFFIQKTSLNYLIFRCCCLYGRSGVPHAMTFFDKLQRSIKKEDSVSLDNYVFNGFLDVYYLAYLMDLCFKNNVQNRLYQICSRDVMTYYDFATSYAKIFQENESLLSKGRWRFPYMMSATSNYDGGELYYNLSITNVESSFNIRMPSIRDSLEFTYKRLTRRFS